MAAPDSASLPTSVKDLKLEKKLGEGFFGEVYRARDIRGGRAGDAPIYAVKRISLELVRQNKVVEQMQREIRIMYSLRHPRILRLHFNFQDSSYIYLGLEYLNGGTMFERIRKVGKFSAKIAATYFLELCEAFDYLHHLPEKVIHRDLKPENVLFDSEDHVKLADFGWANMIDQAGARRRTFCGTTDYLAPEMIMGTGHDESVDMWAMGVLLFEMSTGQAPFAGLSSEATCRNIIAVNFTTPQDFDADARELMLALCKKKKTERLPVREAMSHRFITKFVSKEDSEPASTKGIIATEPESTLAPPLLTGPGVMDRPSEVMCKLLTERKRSEAEMQDMVAAKEAVEAQLQQATIELEAVRAELGDKRQHVSALESKKSQLDEAAAARERELTELRKQAEAMEDRAAKFKRREIWARRLQGVSGYQEHDESATFDTPASPTSPTAGGC